MKRTFGVVLAVIGLLIGVHGAGVAALAANLNSVIVYPNPFEPRIGHVAVTFDNLTASARIRIYKLTGELVYDRELEAPAGTAVWDVTNKDGYPVASGLYVYLVTNSSGQKVTGKLAILK
jgi:hypothetical protein